MNANCGLGISLCSISQFSAPRPVRFHRIAGRGVAGILGGQRRKGMVIDVRIGGRVRTTRPRRHRLQGRHRRHARLGGRGRHQTSAGGPRRVGSVRMVTRVVGHGVVEVRLVEHGRRIGHVLVMRPSTVVVVTRRIGAVVRALRGRERPSGRGGTCWGGDGCCHCGDGSDGNDLFAAQFPLRGEALQVGHEPHAQRILHVHSLDGDQVASHFAGAFTEAHAVVVHRVPLRVVSHRIKS